MEIKASLNIMAEDADRLFRCMRPEAEKEGHASDRASYTLKLGKNKKELIFEITSKDAVAFRATMNAITQLLAVHEKMKKI